MGQTPAMRQPHSILIVDDDVAMRETLTDILEDKGYRVDCADTGRAALDKTEKRSFDVALIDLKLPDIEGTALLGRLLAACPEMACFIVTGHASMQTAIAALRDGAVDYFVKPLHIEKMLHGITTALDKQRIRRELKSSEDENLRNLLIQSVINSIMQASIEDETVDDLMALTMELLLGSPAPIQVPCLAAAIYLLQDQGNSLVLKAHKEKGNVLFALCDTLALDECLCGRAASSRRTVVEDHDADHHAICCRAAEPHRHYSVPIRTKSGVAGVLNVVLGKDGWPRAHEELLVSSVANTLSDILQRRQAERQKSEAERQYRQAQKLEALGSLAGGIAHDFNNILTAILGYAELVYEKLEPGSLQQEDQMQVIRAGKRARELVDQILTFSRRREERELQPVHIHLLVGEALKLLQASLPTTIEIRKQVDKHCGTILADPSQLHQVIMNLCTNAFHAMEEQQHGILEVRLERRVAAGSGGPESGIIDRGASIVLTVKDSGCGMDEATMEHVFDPYFTTKAPDKGTGLGLSVVHGIVKGLGGSITLESALGLGTTFTVFFPVIDAVADGPAPAEPPPPAGGDERILVVEDDYNIAQLFKQQLKGGGYKVTLALGGPQGLSEFRDRPGHYDLVVTDHIMPKLTGAELAGELLAIRPDLPIILCSGSSELFPGDKLAKLGIRGFIKKPFSAARLLHEVRQILDGEE